MKKISERAHELALEDAKRIGLEAQYASIGLVDLWKALDEWQASVEERLASIGLGLVPGSAREEVLATGGAPEGSVLAAMLRGERVTEHRFEIDEPGPSKYDRDPAEPEHQ